MIRLNLDQLEDCFPTTPKSRLSPFLKGLNETFDEFNIGENRNRVACFLSQVGHESGEFRYLQENLNYSAQGLLKVFSKYFGNGKADVNLYARNPEKIANLVYANRMGNGNEASGDGWKFRGRGLIQLTGKFNYDRLSRYLKTPLDEVVKYLETPEGACFSAGWFWEDNKLNPIADINNMELITRRINGGLNGLQHRLFLHTNILNVLSQIL